MKNYDINITRESVENKNLKYSLETSIYGIGFQYDFFLKEDHTIDKLLESLQFGLLMVMQNYERLFFKIEKFDKDLNFIKNRDIKTIKENIDKIMLSK